MPDHRSSPGYLASAPTLDNWFMLVDAGRTDRVLDLLAPDFWMSMQLSRGDGTSVELVGDKAALARYLTDKGRGDLRHEMVAGATVGSAELALGRTIQEDGRQVAVFNASANLNRAAGLVQRLLVCRTAELSLPLDPAGPEILS